MTATLIFQDGRWLAQLPPDPVEALFGINPGKTVEVDIDSCSLMQDLRQMRAIVRWAAAYRSGNDEKRRLVLEAAIDALEALGIGDDPPEGYSTWLEALQHAHAP